MKPHLRILKPGPKTNLLVSFAMFFSSVIYAQPSNNECSGASTLTSATSCSNVQYRLRNATASAGIPVGCASGGTHYDVWFQFTAASTTHTVTISSLQSNFTNPEIQLFSGTCGSLASIVCGTTSMTGTGLTIGATYYIRVSNIGSSISSSDRFNICVTHPPAAPTNDDCGGATTLTPGYTCTNTTGSLYYATSNGPAGACGGATITTTYDVWYTFQATSTSHTLTVSNLGSRLTTATTYMQLLSGSCGSMASLGCQTVSSTNGRLTATGLTIGAFYYARVYILSNPTAAPSTDWNFNICIQRPPANDECAGATALTPGAACLNTASTLDVATASATPPLCFGATYWDVWFQYTATAVSQTISLSSLGSNLTSANIRIQEYSGSCAGLVPLGVCATGTTLTQIGHVIGNTYYVRVALISPSTNPGLANSATNNFNICITNAAAPPSNDLCSGAISITSGSTCLNISGTIHNATASTPVVPGSCGIGTAPDVWYSFVAQSAYPQIVLSSIGTNLQTNGRIQLLTGSCGAFVTVGSCHNIPGSATTTLNTATNPGGAGLNVGQTYYIRITHNTLSSITANGNFNICITDRVGATLDYAKSYVNITDGTVGGTIDPGDVLEVRATLVVARSGSPLTIRSIDSVAFYDTLRAGGGLAFLPGSIALRTNEGKIYKSFTDAFDAPDAGWYSTGGAGTDTAIQINMGIDATNTAKGKLRSTSRPSNFGNTCIILATYRVTVNAAYGTKINFGGGAFSFRDTATGEFFTINFPYDSLMVFESPGSCPNSISPTNILGDEFNGTFGTPSGSPSYPQNRGTSSNTNYSYLPFSASTPNDYYYGIANNTSAAGTTNQTVAKPNAARVFNLWDITGDHTGATNTSIGNLPCNLSSPISATNPCGYMLVINAAYQTDTAFQFSVTGACPSTYYEISAWFKNICYKCGCDSVGRTHSSVGYIPTAPGDTSGVRPNIAIEINGVDYYTTGDIPYQGLGGTQTGSDTLNNWVQKAFVYQTGPSETSFTMTLRNNAPGGGGNDWAMDDIVLKTCSPELDLLPGPNPFVCDSNLVEMSTVVRSFYNNYTYYMWETSTDGGTTWNPTGVSGGPVTPTWNGTEWEYLVAYPPFIAYAADSGSMYRVAVATTAANLASSSCRFSESAEITLTVDPCQFLLGNDLLSFKGRNQNNSAILYWTTSKETEPVKYEIQKSTDGSLFETIGEVIGFANPSSETNNYTYVDPEFLNGLTWYRIKVINTTQNKYKYSKVIQLIDNKAGLKIESLINPFSSQVKFDLISGKEGLVNVELLDQYSHKLRSGNYNIIKGKNNITINNTDNLPAGLYILQVSYGSTTINKKIIKRN